MRLSTLFSTYKKNKELALFHRYITNEMIEPLLKKLPNNFKIEDIGKSVLGKSIYAVKVGTGKKRLFFWSQMHGNESTTTKAIFDVFNTFSKSDSISKVILNECTLLFIPILNPDGAELYTRLNANAIDLNRDAKDLSQPESKLLLTQFEAFKPHFCFNLHGQRTVFSAGETNNVASLSFLAPAEDELRAITHTRKKAMELIGIINAQLQEVIPNKIGRYDDSYNENCVGDTFQKLGVPTILFEAGHYENDYEREITREYIYHSLLIALHHISCNEISGSGFDAYTNIPENGKCFYDVIIRNVLVESEGNSDLVDLGFTYQEKLAQDEIVFRPILEKIERLDGFFGHKEINASNGSVLTVKSEVLTVGYENDFVLLNNEKYSLLFSKS